MKHRNMRVATYHGADQDAIQIMTHQEAEINRLTCGWDQCRELLCQQVADITPLREQVERLRAALERITRIASEHEVGHDQPAAYEMVHIAHEALVRADETGESR